ncbi:ANM5 methyltransferase, partial [Copsychus sechellarum]|nr:ANM5 methyltransferase [Copsychus sechellarum]
WSVLVPTALELGPDLPSAPALARWLGEPVKAALLPTRLFLTNKKGFPVLGRGHQRLLVQLLKLDVQIILQGSPHHGGRPLSAYLQYLEHLGQHRPPPSAYELYARGYEDYLQSPLQPLMDNLESQTYEVFEKDPIKYCQYQQAIFRCLQDRVPEEERETNVQVVMVLGAGRGPLVAASLRAARQAGVRVRIYAVEKNPNAVVTWEKNLEFWGKNLEFFGEKSEFWGEKMRFFGVKIWNFWGKNGNFWEKKSEIFWGKNGNFGEKMGKKKKKGEFLGILGIFGILQAQFETPYVVRLHNFHQVAPPQPCFSFQHPDPDPCPDNGRYAELTWQVQVGTVLHGFAGYFETRLYDDVTLSIRPETHSPGLFSWFPIFFPIKQPVPVRAGQSVSVAFWRVATPSKVWYEWAVTAPVCSALHNPGGRSYTIGQ